MTYMVAPKPGNEHDRIAALHQLMALDTGAEERFDRITRTAQSLLKVPIAQITLVDKERQWFKSSCGLPRGETSRDVSFCAHAILQKGPMVISDALNDPRFRCNPLVLGDPHIRFYAGVPLKGPNRLPVGTLCVIDRAPRNLSPTEIGALEDLAVWAEEQLNQWEITQALDLMRKSEAHLQTVLGAIPEGVITLRKDGVIDSVNRVALSFFGYADHELIGRDFSSLLLEGSGITPLTAPEFLQREMTGVRQDGSRFPVEIAIRAAGGSFPFLVALVRDLTSRKRLEDLRQDLVQMIVHDLRSPLNGIMGFADLLMESESLSAQAQEDLSGLSEAANRMRNMVSDVLDVARLEVGQLPVRLRVCDMCSLADSVIHGLGAAARHRVALDCPSNGLPPVQGDCEHLGRVIENLLSNALRFAPPDSTVLVRVEHIGSDIEVSVRDEGVGIEVAQQARIFEKFGQAAPGQRHTTGLGLTFCKLAIEAHGGTVGVRSQPGQGSTFWFRLPATYS